MLDRLHNYSVAVVAAAVTLVALLGVVLSLTLLKPANQVAATVTSGHELTMTRGGVLPLFDKEVVVTVSAGSTDTVALVQGSTADVKGWIGTAGYTEIIGVESDYERLAIVDHAGTPVLVDAPQSADSSQSSDASQSAHTPQSAVSPQSGVGNSPQSAAHTPQSGADNVQSGDTVQSGNTVAHKVATNDMWTNTVTGVGEVQMRLSDVHGSTSILAVSSGEKPTLTLSWAVQQRNLLYGISAVIAGIFAALTLFAFARQHRLERSREERAITLSNRRSADTTDTDSWPATELEAYTQERERGGRPHPQDHSSEEDTPANGDGESAQTDEYLVGEKLRAEDQLDHLGELVTDSAPDRVSVMAGTGDGDKADSVEDIGVEGGLRAADQSLPVEEAIQESPARSEEGPVRRTAWGRKTLQLAGVVSVNEEPAKDAVLSSDETPHIAEENRAESEIIVASDSGREKLQPTDQVASTHLSPSEEQPRVEVVEPLGRHAGASSIHREDEESVTTDTGTIDLSGVRPGAILPSRRALREARERGESALIIEGHSFDTGLIPQIAKVDARDIENMTDGGVSHASAKVEEYIVDVAPEGASHAKTRGAASESGWTSMMTSWVRGRKSEEENR